MPIEVKSGSAGTLKALHLFMATKKHQFAVRLNTDHPSITNIKTKIHDAKESLYQLISIPIYLTEQIHRLISQHPNK